MRPAIRVENLSKRYRVGTRRRPAHRNLTESLTAGVRGLLGGLTGRREPQEDGEFWALRDVSFDVQPGEVVGVIGRNGAGKSTLLKVLSRIVEPTAGRCEVRGRMGSMLEVGTGFHPELTGRENVYLSGSVLGMTRKEIDRKFDQVAAFSEIEQFLDTPVKRYSSGMYIRLAFSVVAHLEPEILIVDEVLAVGDATFQRRCIDRMAELARSGRTILFVSHNMQMIPLLCQRAVLLERGRVGQVGPAGSVTQVYLNQMLEEAGATDLREKHRSGDGRARFVRARLVDDSGRPTPGFASDDDLTVQFEIESSVATNAAASVMVSSQHGNRLFTSWTKEEGYQLALRPGLQGFQCRFRNVVLRPGHTVLIHLWLYDGEVMDWVDNALVVEVAMSERLKHLSQDSQQGVIVYPSEWREVPVS